MANRQFVSFPFTDLYKIKQQVLNWSARFNTCCFLDNQQYPSELPGYECLAAVGERARLEASAGNAFDQLKGILPDTDRLAIRSFFIRPEIRNRTFSFPAP